MLKVAGRTIALADANGNTIRTIVTAYADRVVGEATLLGDHHTVWYETNRDYRLPYDAKAYNCSDVVRLDLATNRRTVIAHADGFSVSADGRRVFLLNVLGDDKCSTRPAYGQSVNIVRDVATGRQSTVAGDVLDYAISAGGHVLAATRCTSRMDLCRFPLETATLPDVLGAPITLHRVNDQTLTFRSLVARDDGLYAIVDTHEQNCGCGGREDRYDSDITVRRLSWNNLGGSGTTLFTVHGPLYFDNIVVTGNGLYGVGGVNAKAPRGLFHLSGNSASSVHGLAENDWRPYYTLSPFAG